MCGRYSLVLRPAQIRQLLQDDDMVVDEAPEDEGDDAPRQSYNFAPGYHGMVYRANTPDWGAGPPKQHANASSEVLIKNHSREGAVDDTSESQSVSYKLQSMKWGLVPFWTKRNPDFGSTMKTINCRDDSLAQSGGMWSTMKARKRCIVIAQGFYEWLKKDGGREKIPHYVKRKDGRLMCFAGLWDVVQYENDEQKHYTYTIITTSSNKQLNFLHDRMPVILQNGSDDLRMWLDPKHYEWSKQLQALLNPYEGELDVYPVSKDVGKVGNNSPTFIIPVDSKENKSNIANFFAKGATKKGSKKEQPDIEVKKEEGFVTEDSTKVKEESKIVAGVKREAEDMLNDEEPLKKLPATTINPPSALDKPQSPQKGGRQKISATRNRTRSPNKTKQPGTQKITKFFANSS
ncbi:DUF159-domain-containing protein [Annulohypoxylon maeteangense]|uniref:DUF159-domain-containing protein n=1 Tax=Annulohypoxylon maeteangense TaxID=1927788 RepID=UPI002008139F|nr:DUF159-domain-containing protein [Annulohypoxylon maeteangense]KAI0885605.1 DUF159-domain-containing protein [Annulohypoxylon maeteangense]